MQADWFQEIFETGWFCPSHIYLILVDVFWSREEEVRCAYPELSWSLDAEILLTEKNLLKMIKLKSRESSSEMENAQALYFLRHHLSTILKNECRTERNPKILWDSLHERFEKIESVLLSKVEHEWNKTFFS